MRNDAGRSRSGAYNPGSFGAARDQEAFAKRLPGMQAALFPVAEMLDRAAGRDTECRVCHSAELLAVLEGGFGLGKDCLWLGHQICLDLGAIQPAWFDAATIAVLGPGALDWLGRIYCFSH